VVCALVASKLGVKAAHVEAGLRSFDRTMPEEINRVLTDHLADLLFTTEPSGNENLCHEGIPEEKIRFVGNTMIGMGGLLSVWSPRSARRHVRESRDAEPMLREWASQGYNRCCVE